MEVLVDGGGSLLVGFSRGGSLKNAEAIASAIFAAGPFTTQPTSRGETPQIHGPGVMCDVATVAEVNTITGGAYAASTVGDPVNHCYYADPATFANVSFDVGPDAYDLLTVGTYTSEELTVADRPATWDIGQYGLSTLAVDAGAGQIFEVDFTGSPATPDALRGYAIAIAETALGRMVVGAPPPPAATGSCLLATTDEVASITGIAIASSTSMGDTACGYVGGDGKSGVVMGTNAGTDPELCLAVRGQQHGSAGTDHARRGGSRRGRWRQHLEWGGGGHRRPGRRVRP